MRTGVVALACAVAAGLVLAGCGDDDGGDEQTLTYTEGRGEFNPIGGASEQGAPPGSGFVLTIPLEDDSGTEAGKLYAVCVATEETSGQEDLLGVCTGTADFDGSQLALNVGGAIGESVTGSIIGGTGDYAGATGTFESTGGDNATDTFTFTLP